MPPRRPTGRIGATRVSPAAAPFPLLLPRRHRRRSPGKPVRVPVMVAAGFSSLGAPWWTVDLVAAALAGVAATSSGRQRLLVVANRKLDREGGESPAGDGRGAVPLRLI